MGKLIGFGLIGYGVGTLLTIGIMAIGGMEVMVGLFLPMVSYPEVVVQQRSHTNVLLYNQALRMAPVDQLLLAWVEVPLSMAIQGRLSNVTTFKEDGILGGGRIDFEVIMAGGGYDSAEEPVAPALWVEEV